MDKIINKIYYNGKVFGVTVQREDGSVEELSIDEAMKGEYVNAVATGVAIRPKRGFKIPNVYKRNTGKVDSVSENLYKTFSETEINKYGSMLIRKYMNGYEPKLTENTIVLYHGGELYDHYKVLYPNFDFSNNFNIYGTGFYCSSNSKDASIYSKRYESNGVVDKFYFDTTDLTCLDLYDFKNENSKEFRLYNLLNLIIMDSYFISLDKVNKKFKTFRTYCNSKYTQSRFSRSYLIVPDIPDELKRYIYDVFAGKLSLEFLYKVMECEVFNKAILLKGNVSFKRLAFAGYDKTEHNADDYYNYISECEEKLSFLADKYGASGKFYDEEVARKCVEY